MLKNMWVVGKHFDVFETLIYKSLRLFDIFCKIRLEVFAEMQMF